MKSNRNSPCREYPNHSYECSKIMKASSWRDSWDNETSSLQHQISSTTVCTSNEYCVANKKMKNKMEATTNLLIFVEGIDKCLNICTKRYIFVTALNVVKEACDLV